MRRQAVRIEDVAEISNLSTAFCRAALGKRDALDVVKFARSLDRNLAVLGDHIRTGTVEVGRARTFVIRDPKRRIIHAPAFRERVLHHALMSRIEPALERGLVADTFACRPGKGGLAAVRRAQEHTRRFPWYVKIDVRRYFDSIDHRTLLRQLDRRIKGSEVIGLCARIIGAFSTATGKGLPIGALTSQHFANSYLASFDRFLLETQRVGGMIRYMDDVVWWVESRDRALETLDAARGFVRDELLLEVKPSAQIQPSRHGVPICGFRVLADRMLLSRRRRRRYAEARRRHETAWLRGEIDSFELQRRMAAALAITAHADSVGWRRSELARRGCVEA